MRHAVGLGLRRITPDFLPPGRFLELPGRGRTFVVDVAGPPGAPTVFLFHALSVTAYLNWFPAFGPLSEHFRVVTMDLRGHGRGIALEGRFRLSDCADDAAAVADELGIERFVAVGYSLGGPIAQLVWHRHRERVAGLVVSATSRNFGGTPQERAFYATLLGAILAVRLGRWVRRGSAAPEAQLPQGLEDKRIAEFALTELRRISPNTLFQAMDAMGRFSSHRWVEQIDVPSAAVITTRDRFISPSRQLKLARAIPGTTLHPCEAGHAACVLGARRFVPALVDACTSVADRLPTPRDSRPQTRKTG